MGPEGYHWRVCVEDKAPPGDTSGRKSFSWWDIQDENAVLPVKEASTSQLRKFFEPPREDSVSDQATKAAKGAFKSLGKALAGGGGGGHDSAVDHGPPVCVIAFKLLDLVKVHDDFTHKNHGRGGHIPQEPTPRSATSQRSRAPPRPAPASAPRSGGYQAPSQPAARPQQQQQPRAPPSAPRPPPPPQEDLMGFGTPSSAPSRPPVRHTQSMPTAAPAGETREQRLAREYKQKNATAQRVWDEVDQRWVEKEPLSRSVSNASSTSGRSRNIGISLDPTSAMGKSEDVQKAVYARVNEMKEAQAKALNEVREREAKKKQEEAEEDDVRKRLEPKIKAWSEEHGKKKQLRALLGTLHTILWPEAKWKQVSIGDILNDAKCKKFYHKATLVVHPDKTHHLDAEKRFLAKRIFDALSQAKVEFDAGKK